MEVLTAVTALMAAVVAPSKQSHVTVRIYTAVNISAQEWKATQRRTEKIIHDDQGRKFALRLIEFE